MRVLHFPETRGRLRGRSLVGWGHRRWADTVNESGGDTTVWSTTTNFNSENEDNPTRFLQLVSFYTQSKNSLLYPQPPGGSRTMTPDFYHFVPLWHCVAVLCLAVPEQIFNCHPLRKSPHGPNLNSPRSQMLYIEDGAPTKARPCHPATSRSESQAGFVPWFQHETAITWKPILSSGK
jgi:hypothetical protein